jgi:hypothetical protein
MFMPMRAARPQCHVMLMLLMCGTVLGLRDADTNKSGMDPVSRDDDTTDMRHSFGVT